MKNDPLQLKIAQLARRLQQGDRTVRKQSTDNVPAKKKSKPVQYKMQNTFDKNLKSVPGSSRHVGASIVKQIAAQGTGTKVVKAAPGLLRSMRNANTTQGSYVTAVVTDETGRVVSDSQGRRVFGR